MNNSTTITLNDRFSMIKKPNGFQQPQGGRGRSKSRSRGRSQQQQKQPVGLHGSRRNQKLLDQLEKQHKMRLALKLKNVKLYLNITVKIIKLLSLTEEHFEISRACTRSNRPKRS